MMFNSNHVDIDILSTRAYNLRWATLPKGVIPLTAADPDFPVAPPIQEALKDYIDGGYLSYGPAEGLPQFRDAVARDYKKKNKVAYDSNCILPVDSAAFGIYLCCKALLKPGDEVIIFDPVDFLFKYSAEKVGAKTIAYQTPQKDDAFDFNELSSLISSKTKMICLCNPLNPTGKVFTREELFTLAEVVAKHKDIIVLSDEIWSDIIFNPNTFNAFASIRPVFNQTITVTGYSKSYGLAGLRIGSVLCPNEIIYNQILESSLHQSTVHGANVLGQVAATAALNDAQQWLSAFVTHLHKMRDLTVQKLNEMPGISCKPPEGCYVLFPDITQTAYTATELHENLLEKAKVAVVPGLPKWFGSAAEGHIRLSFATSEELLTEALHRIHKFLETHK